jgi:hypothetical protein
VIAMLLVPMVAQALVMAVDEGVFHRRRGLPRWERIGHPLDTLTVVACFAYLLLVAPGRGALAGYLVLASGSCLFITKDEPVHARLCSPGEHWLHALLFVLHPIVFLAAGVLWWTRAPAVYLAGQLGLTLAFLTYQLVYWSFLCRDR